MGLLILITFTATKGVEKITKVISIGGLAVTPLNLVLLFGSLLVLALNGGPVFFTIIALTIYKRYEKVMEAKKKIKMV